MAKVYFGGLPTGIDVRRLREAFPTINEGDEIQHDDMERVLNLKRDSNRYRTVTSAWRAALLREDGIEVAALPGVGFRCLTPAERISGSIRGFQSGTRKQLRSVKRAVQVRTDDPSLVKRQDLLRRYGAAVAAESASMMREIEPPKRPEQLPRLVPKTSNGS